VNAQVTLARRSPRSCMRRAPPAATSRLTPGSSVRNHRQAAGSGARQPRSRSI